VIPLQFFKPAVFLACALSLAAADYTTYIDDFSYTVTGMAVDAVGNTYVTGSRAVIVTEPGATVTFTDIFVSKLDPSGNLTLLATISGKASDRANAIALDPAGHIYLAGSTTSTNFPLRDPLQSVLASPSYFPPLGTGFVVKLGPDGTVLYSTYLGGTMGPSSMNAVAADSQGNAYVTGETYAPDYPRTAGLPQGTVGPGVGAISAAFFAKISPAGDKILYAGGLAAATRGCHGGSSCFLSMLSNSGRGIAVDAAGNAYLVGNTYGTDLPTTPGALRTDGIGAFVAKVNSSGTSMGYVTLLAAANYNAGGVFPGSNPGTLAYAIAADAAGNAYIAGSTSDPAFPATPSAFQTMLSVTSPPNSFSAPPSDAFVAKLNPTGSAMVWATFLGGTNTDMANTVATDSAGNVWVSGTTSSADFPASDGFPGGQEFVAGLNAAGSSLLYSSRYPANTVAAALAVDPGGTVHVAGSTGLVSAFIPSKSSAGRIFGLANAAGGVLAGRVAPVELISIYGLHLGVSTPVYASFDASGFLPTTLAGIQVAFNGTPAPLLYVSDTQINAVVPLVLANMPSASLRVALNSGALPDFRLAVDTAIPQVARNADGSAASINQDGSVNSSTHPAPAGSFVSIWATGIGYAPGVDGQMATSAQSFCGCIIHDLATNQDIVPSYAGTAPGMVTGVVQINFQVPATGTSFYLNVSGKISDTFSISVSQ
jgi:uncharacterized protein (TIGR03437 family)